VRLLLPLYRWVLLLLVLVSGFIAQAQPEPIKFGQLDPQLLTAAPFAADSAAEAVVLCDYGTATIVGGDQVRFDRITRIKILKKLGFDWAKVEVLLHHDLANNTEQLSNLRGVTYNLVNGQLTQDALAATGIFVDKVSDFYSRHKFALPKVREGSVVEFSYSISSDYLGNFHGWQFQRRIPVRWSEFRATIPASLVYKIFLQQTQPLAMDEKPDPKSASPYFRWAMRDVPAFHSEPFMTTEADYIDELSFELSRYNGTDYTKSWAQIDEHIIRLWQQEPQLTLQSLLKADLAQLPRPTANNALQRLAAVRSQVCAAVKCTGKPELLASGSLRKTYRETHLGNVADVNLVLIAALRVAGFTANPVLLSTRSHGRVRTALPQISQFNYVAAHVQLPDGQDLVLDATDPLLPYDLLPERCLNQQGRLVAEKGGTSRWLEIKPRHRHTHLQRVQLRLDPTGVLSGDIHEEFAGYAGARERDDLRDAGEQKYWQQLARVRADFTLTGQDIANRDSVHLPLALNYAFTLPSAHSQPLDAIYLSPLRDFSAHTNPFRAETRSYPVDFGTAREDILLLTLTLPAGYELAELPKPQTLVLPDNGGRFVCSVTSTGSVVQLISRLTLHKPQYAAAEYGQLREFYRRLREKQAEKLVIKKKV
jgi:hypothetical protein